MSLAHRHAGLEVGRVLAALAIVWLHTAGIGPTVAPYGAFGRFAVPYFTLLSVALVVDRAARSPTAVRDFVRGRLVRLYLPFVAWTAVYLALRWLKAWVAPSTPPPPVGWHLALIGSAHHLWYLPFILAVTVTARVLTPTLTPRPKLGAAVFAGLGAVTAFTDLEFRHDPRDPGFVNQVSYLGILGWAALPACCWGVALGLWLPRAAGRLRGRWGVSLLAFVATFACLWPGDGAPLRGLRENLAGAVAVAGCLAVPTSATLGRLAGWGTPSLGVYLTHVAWILALEAVVVPSRADFTFAQAAGIFLGAVAGSAVTTAALARSRATKWLVL